MGVGIYHSGVEILGTEYAFGGNTTVRTTGVYSIPPRSHQGFSFKHSIDLGEIPVEPFFKNGKRHRNAKTTPQATISFNHDIVPILDELMDKYRANKYNLLLKNCNHFSDDFIKRLYAGKKRLPGYVNRAANIGSLVHCFVPTKYVTVTPPGCEEEAARLAALWAREEESKK